MRIEYVRNMQFGYMKIALDKTLSKIEAGMLSGNTIEGILSLRLRREDGKSFMCYDITGMQALDSLLESRQADEKLLRALLIGVIVTVTQLGKYLLSQDGLCLAPEMVFWDIKTETMQFCYIPEDKTTLQEQLLNLMEYMLAKTDHKDILAVQLAYDVYEEIQKPAFCINDLRECIQKGIHAAETQQTEGIIENITVQEEPEEVFMTKAEKKRYFLEQILRKLQLKKRADAWIKKKRGLKEQEELVLFEESTIEEEEESVTTLLDTSKNTIKGVLKYEGDNFLADMIITETPFTIGSDKGCNGVVKHPNISRYHAKITYQEGNYFIEDLNSTNGTIVNGGLLNYKTKVSLKKDERIYLANEPYRFM